MVSVSIADIFVGVHYGFWSWDKPDSAHSFVQFRTNFRTTTYFCINFPTATVQRIVQSVIMRPECAKKLFYVDVLVTDDLLINYRGAISKRNSQLISIEKEKDSSGIAAQTKRLHDLSVNWHTLYKDLIDLEEQIKHFREVDEANVQDSGPVFHGVRLEGCSQSLAQLESKCRFYRRWAMAYRDRTNSRINLVRFMSFALLYNRETDC
jgi:hypothetical protein